jgi:hypothetical protein
MSAFKFDWNVIMEVLIGVILYKIIDPLFDMIFRIIKNGSITLYQKLLVRMQKRRR